MMIESPFKSLNVSDVTENHRGPLFWNLVSKKAQLYPKCPRSYPERWRSWLFWWVRSSVHVIIEWSLAWIPSIKVIHQRTALRHNIIISTVHQLNRVSYNQKNWFGNILQLRFSFGFEWISFINWFQGKNLEPIIMRQK